MKSHDLKYPSVVVDMLLGFVNGLNEYDRERGLKDTYGMYDPSKRKDWQKLFFEDGFVRYGFRFGPNGPIDFDTVIVSVNVLLESLRDPGFDWDWLITENDGYFEMPSFWTIINARLIFEEAYRAVYLHWQAAICNRGLSLPDPELLGIPQLETI